MRFVTFETDGQQRPGLMIDGQSILDLPRAFVIAASRGIVGADIGGAKRLIDVISGGETVLAACRAVLDHAADAEFAPARMAVSDISLTAPIPRPAKNVCCVGSNYRAHIAEGARARNKEYMTPEHPVFFTKPPPAVIGPGGTIELDASVSEKMA